MDMKDETPISDTQLGDYLAGRLSPKVRAQIADWIRKQPDQRALLARLADARSAIQERHQREVAPLVDAGVATLRAWAIGSAQQTADSKPQIDDLLDQRLAKHTPMLGRSHAGGRSTSSRMSVWSLRRHATLWLGLSTLAVVAGVVLYTGRDLFGRGHSRPRAAQTYTTADGQQAVVTLADGSRVTLAPHSTLTVDAHFADGTRSGTRAVSLVGEAVFDVARQRSVPFIVHTGPVTTRVLGTMFDVRRYADDQETRVAVTNGKVVVSAAPNEQTMSRRLAVVLTAGTVGRVTDSTATAVMVDSIADYTRWTSGVLVFRRTPVPEAIAMIGRWYGFTFQLADSALATDSVTATFDHQPAAEVLTRIRSLLDVNMTFKNDHIIVLHPRQTVHLSAPTHRDVDHVFSPHLEVGR